MDKPLSDAVFKISVEAAPL